jgi:hypothetical protein
MVKVKEINVSSGSGESDNLSVVSETLPAEEEVVFADETDLAGTSSALAAVFPEFTGVSSPE